MSHARKRVRRPARCRCQLSMLAQQRGAATPERIRPTGNGPAGYGWKRSISLRCPLPAQDPLIRDRSVCSSYQLRKRHSASQAVDRFGLSLHLLPIDLASDAGILLNRKSDRLRAMIAWQALSRTNLCVLVNLLIERRMFNLSLGIARAARVPVEACRDKNVIE